ncbi:MAG: peptidase M22 [Firmicutes bacterium]|nr:peptidase M22 [Bacillota bacterium]
MIAINHGKATWVVGIDTSAYTTSVAWVTEDGRLREAREVLAVPAGSRGLRPSEALFQHTKVLPRLLEQLMNERPSGPFGGVAVSVAPRPQADSYLPPFLVGELAARSIAAASGVPVWRTTHQEGHIRAGMVGARMPSSVSQFLAVHLSGGTTELVSVTVHGPRLRVERLGATDDLYAGQFVDRIGVLLGLPFPAGPALDALAETSDAPFPLPSSPPRWRDGLWRISFSGPETAARRAIEQGRDASRVAKGVVDAIARSVSALIQKAAAPQDVLVVGGVAANTHIRRVLSSRLERLGYRIWFADPHWSRDNAIGVAYLGLDAWRAGSAEAPGAVPPRGGTAQQ